MLHKILFNKNLDKFYKNLIGLHMFFFLRHYKVSGKYFGPNFLRFIGAPFESLKWNAKVSQTT